MHIHFVSLILLALTVSAAPSNKRESRMTIPLIKKSNLVKDGVVDAEALRGHVSYVKSKYANTLAQYERNTGNAHPSARTISATVKRDAGGINLQNNNDFWYGPMAVDEQELAVLFDTGSSDIFLPGPKCGDSCKGHKIYDPSGATDANEQFQFRYGDNSTVSGEVYTDSVTVAGLMAQNQALGVASEYSSSLEPSKFPADGLMGLAYPEIAVIKATEPFFNTLMKQGTVSAGEFGFKLAASGSSLYLGGVDSSASSGNLNTIPVTQKGYWQVNLDSVDIGGSAVVSHLSAIVDTGTTLVIGDPKSVSAFYGAIPGSQDASSTVGDGFYTFPCDSNPKVALTFGGVAYDISSTFNLGTATSGSSDCVGGITGVDTGIDAWIAGDVFLQNVYAQFSFDHDTVGFSKQA